MANSTQPSAWNYAVVPAGAGRVTVTYTDTSTTFTATANEGYRFDHWVFTPYSGSASAPGQWMPALADELSKNLTSNPHVSGRYEYDAQEYPEYNQAGILGTAYFVKDDEPPSELLSVTTQANPAGSGFTMGDGMYVAGTTVQLTAIPNIGFKFSQWKSSTGQTSQSPVFSYVVTADVVWTAYFGTGSGWLVYLDSGSSSEVGRLIYDPSTGQLIYDDSPVPNH